MPCEDCQLLQKVNRSITNLKEDIRSLSAELIKKDSLLTSFTDTTSAQSKRISALNSAISNTILWDPATCHQPSSCSTPNHPASWTEVVVRGHRRRGQQPVSPSSFNL